MFKGLGKRISGMAKQAASAAKSGVDGAKQLGGNAFAQSQMSPQTCGPDIILAGGRGGPIKGGGTIDSGGGTSKQIGDDGNSGAEVTDAVWRPPTCTNDGPDLVWA
ncbi:MAG: hypothetical protein H6737_15800 [Alphaproteobacteria bacterium]|nr:hypothetical protein [Alphaproteobacteria bacterium]